MKEKLLKLLNLKSEDIKKEDIEQLIVDIKDVASSLLSIVPNQEPPQPESIDEIVAEDDDIE